MGDPDQDPRGWSLIYEDRTDATSETEMPGDSHPERTVSQAMDLDRLDPAEATDANLVPDLDGLGEFEGADPPTIIDQDLSQDVLDALEPSLLNDTDPALADDRLANVALALEDAEQELVAPIEQTVRTTSPFLGEASSGLDEETIPAPSIETTQKTRIPYDLRAEHTLPPSAGVRPRAPSPKVMPVPEAEAPAQPLKTRAERPDGDRSNPAERTSIDIAAALGIAPEPAPLEPEISTPSRPLEPQLQVPEKGAGAKLDLGLDAAPKPTKKKAPSEGMRSDQLAGLAESTDRISRLIPIVLGILVLLATIAVSLQLFKRQERQEHVELRFLAIGGTADVTRASDVGTPVVIETEPPGLLVLYDRQVLGKTPFTGTVPVDLEDKVAVELSSPYFERWLGEVRRGPAGDYTIAVQLARRARR